MTNNYSVRFIVIEIIIFNFATRLHCLPYERAVESNKTKVQQEIKNTNEKITKNLEYIIPYTSVDTSGSNEDFQAQSLSKVRKFLIEQLSKMKRSTKSSGVYLKNDGTLISHDYYPDYVMSDDSEEKVQNEFIDSTEVQFECVCEDDNTECQKCIESENEKRLKILNLRNLNRDNSESGTKTKVNIRQSRTQPTKINIPFTKNMMIKSDNTKAIELQKYLLQSNEEPPFQLPVSQKNDFSNFNSASHVYDKLKENIPVSNLKKKNARDNIKLIVPNNLSKYKVDRIPTFRTNQESKPVNTRSAVTGSVTEMNSEENEEEFDLRTFICSIINCLAYGNKFGSNSELNKKTTVEKKIPIKKTATSIDCPTTAKAPTIDVAKQPKNGLTSDKNKTIYKSRYLVDIKPLTLDDIENYNFSHLEIKPEQPSKTVNNSNDEFQNKNHNSSSGEKNKYEGEILNEIIVQNTIKKIINNLVPGKAQDLLVNYANEENLPKIVSESEELLPEIQNVPVLKNLFAIPEIENMILDAANGLIGQLLGRPTTNEVQNLIKTTLHNIVETIPFRTDVESPNGNKFKKSVWNDGVVGFYGNSLENNAPPKEVFDMLMEILNKSELSISSVTQPIAQNLIVKATKYALDKKRGVIDESTIIQAYNMLVKPKYQFNSEFVKDPDNLSPNYSDIGAPKPFDKKITQPKNRINNSDNIQTDWPESIFSDNNEDDKALPLTPIKENVLTKNGSSYTIEKTLQNKYEQYDEDKKKALIEKIKHLTKDQVTAAPRNHSTIDQGSNEQMRKDILNKFEEQHPLDNDSNDPKKQTNPTVEAVPHIDQEKKKSMLDKLKKINPQAIENKVPGINDVLKKAIVKNLNQVLNVTTIPPETKNLSNGSEIDFENSKILAPTEMEIIPAASMNEPIKYYSNEGVLANYQKLHPPAHVAVKESIGKDFAGESSQLSKVTLNPEAELIETNTNLSNMDQENVGNSARVTLPSYMGKLVPLDANRNLKNTRGSKLEFVGDGVRLPLTIRRMSDGTFSLILNDDLMNVDTSNDGQTENISLKLKRHINSIAQVTTTRKPHERLKKRKKRAYTELDWKRSQEEMNDSSIEEIPSDQIPKPDVDFVIRKMKRLLQSLLSVSKKSSTRVEPIIKRGKYRSNDRKNYYRSDNSNDDTIVIVKSPSFPIKVAYDKPKVNLLQKLREKRRQFDNFPSRQLIKPTFNYQLSNPFKLFNSIGKWKHPNGYTKNNYMYQKIAKDDAIVGTKAEVVQDVLQLVKNIAINVPKKMINTT